MSKNIIKVKNNNGLILQDSTINTKQDILMSISGLLKNGQIMEAKDLLDSLSKTVAGHHPLYPYYSTEIENKNGKLSFSSKPNSKEAIKKYPPRYEGKMTIPKKYRKFSSMNELLDYSYRNQEDIEVNVKEIRKLLGDLDDPFQDDIFDPENLEKATFKIKCEEFPPAKPFKIIFGNSDYTIDYLLFRVQKIDDENIVTLGNLEQEVGIYMEIRANVLGNKFDFNIKIKEEYKRDVSTNLDFINFMINCKKENELKIISLESGDIFMSGILNKVKLETQFVDEEQEREFLESLKIIENYYNKKINLLDEISDDDIINATMLSKGIKDGKVFGRVNSLSNEFIIEEDEKEKMKEKIAGYKDRTFPVEYESSNIIIKIFNETFKVNKIVRKFEKLKIKDVERVIKKIDILEEGDKINIKFIPINNEENEFVDEFYFD